MLNGVRVLGQLVRLRLNSVRVVGVGRAGRFPSISTSCVECRGSRARKKGSLLCGGSEESERGGGRARLGGIVTELGRKSR